MAEAMAPSQPQSRRPSILLRVHQSRRDTQNQGPPRYPWGAIAAYMTVILQFIPVVLRVYTEPSDQLLFYGSYFSFMLQVVYYWISFVPNIRHIQTSAC